ncbi:TPA_asm: P3 protein [Celmisia lyallii enamovirus]|nr:TPA_asm: P3 protein [Celmisia lyallii enamovirus]
MPNNPNRRQKKRKNIPKRVRPAQKPVVVLRAPPPNRRRGRNRRNGAGGEWSPYNLFGLKCNDKGYLTFGPSGDTPSLGGGVLKAYSEYRITALRVQWKAQASSTAAGSMAIQIGLGKTLTDVDNRTTSFKLTSSGTKFYGSGILGGTGRNYATKASGSTGEDQFRLAYNGNGDSTVGGDLLCSFKMLKFGPK